MKIIINESQFNFLCKNDNYILTEQRKFFTNISDAFRGALKNFDELDTFTRFINREIYTVNDMIKHVDDFQNMWKMVNPNLNLQKLKRNLIQLEEAVANGKLKSIPEGSVFEVLLPAFPERGGMRDIVYDLWLEANGRSRLVPSTKETRIVKKDPISGEIIIITPEDSLNILYKYGNPNKRGWIEFGSKVEWPNHSGWKFHIFGSTLEDSAFLIERLTPVSKKYGAHGKVGGVEQVNHVKMKPGTPQHGKQGATIYIPKSVIDKNQQGAMLSDIKSAIQGYNNKGGNIMGDKMITPQIHYRNELIGAPPNGGFRDWEHYNQYYNKNSGGPYKPNDVEDLFSNNKVTKTIPINYLSTKFGDTSEIDWSKIVNAKSVEEYDIFINDAIKSNNYNMISRGGFENYGIYNFREYLKNNH